MRRVAERPELGQAVLIFALLLPVFLGLSGVVIGIGNWYVHGKHLQTKADAGAFAGGSAWEFPCGTQIDARIAAQARLYAESNNPQVGGVPNSSIHSVLNGTDYYDDDANPAPAEFNSPSGPVCNANILDVKVTEDNSFPLASLIPLFPDIKRKARVEIQQVEGVTDLLPIAVRAPEPVSAAAVYFNEASGAILAVKYFVKDDTVSGIPAGLQPWSTNNTEDSSTWASFTPTTSTGVAIAISFRGACNTSLPNPNTKILTTAAPCFEDTGFATVHDLCNQGGATQILNCYYATGTWPNETVQSGLHFIRGYSNGNVGQGQPELRSAWLENVDCPSAGAYFNSINLMPSCEVRLKVRVDVGSKSENPLPNPPNANVETRVAANVEVKYCLVLRGQTAANVCNSQFGTNEELNGSGGPGEVEFATTASTHLTIPRNTNGAAVAIQVRLRDTSVAGVPGCDLAVNDDFTNQCRFFYTGAGFTSTSVPPSGAAVLAAPVQRAFRGNSVSASSIEWLRLTGDQNCDGSPETIGDAAASQPVGANRCLRMDMGLRGGLAKDADDPVILFNDGIGSSQMGSLDCDPNINQGQVLIDAVIDGCGPWYAKHPFDWSPLCPQQNNIFATPNPGAPWNDGRWPPLRCVKTRPTGSMNQLERGLDGRLFDNQNTNSCPGDGPGYIKGRNYWKQGTNQNTTFGYKDNSPARDTQFPPGDPRLVTIFLVPTEAFTGSGQNTYPITGFIEVYITGYGRINGSGNLNVDDPCPGQPPPSDLDCGGASCGYAVWGHMINYTIPSGAGTPSGVLCNPGGSAQPCVAVLVE